ncbi:MAG: DUF5717 family protein, partial [Defluviitaleaceae bacterium]|nr:DUF5717 family protein [Defluviitaleaceae bacterium]
KILDTANLTRNSSKNVQSVFVQMAEHGTQHESKTEILADFAMFLAYEVLVNGLLPEKPTVRAMEDIFERENADVMAYALAHIYIIEGGAATHRAGLILADALERAEESNILFPIFKDIKDKSVILPYIERNRPFVYIGRPQNEVVLHYKIKDEAEDDFVKMPMKYLGFGMFMCHIPQFYGEEIEYFFHEEREKGSVKTTPQFVNNNNPHMLERAGDLYYTINNALVFEQMFKYEQVEEIVTARLAKKAGLRAKIM